MQPSREHFIRHPGIINYLDMINDGWRNKFFLDALAQHAPGQVVMDIGTGTGILSFFALASGAAFVYAVERDQSSAQLAQQVLQSKFDQSRFKVVVGDFFTDDIDPSIFDRPVNVLVAELVGPGLFDQGQIHAWHCAKPYLAPGAISIPDRLSCDLWTWSGNTDILLQTQVPDHIKENTSVLKRTVRSLYADECLNQDYVNALVNIDQQYRHRASPQLTWPQLTWTVINAIETAPTKILTNVVNYTMSQLPALQFSSEPYPRHIKPLIEFDVDIVEPSTVAIINKMHFENHTLYIKDARFMPWRRNPVFVLPEPARYRLTYNNFDLILEHEQEWLCGQIANL